MRTLLLDLDKWDLVVDAAGNIAVAEEPYAYAQDVASAIKLFLRELFYDTSAGVPYWEEILGKTPPINVFQNLLERAALTVPDVVKAQCVINSFTDRDVDGEVDFTTSNGTTGTVQLGTLQP